jgi:hypothetical protein
MFSQECALLRLRVVADGDPTSLARVIERFQNLNVLARRVIAEFGTNGAFHIQVDVFGLAEERLTLIAAKMFWCICGFGGSPAPAEATRRDRRWL